MPLSVTFNFTGGVQTWVVPALRGTTIEVECWGAQGGLVGAAPGLGGYSKGTLAVTVGETLNLYVGGQPSTPSNAVGDGRTFGWNGGGPGGETYRGNDGNNDAFGGGGGGASDIRKGGTALANRVIVAGGGGGGGSGSNYGGGHGGGGDGTNQGTDGGAWYQPSVNDGVTRSNGTRGLASQGGSAGQNYAAGDASTRLSTPMDGFLGVGGDGGCAVSSTNYNPGAGGGGGGGYYGGGGGGWRYDYASGAGGGGGSGYVGGVTNPTGSGGVRSGHGLIVITYEPAAKPRMMV